MSELPIGNTKLVDYGIQNEESDIRAHVSVTTKRVYVFETQSGRNAIEENEYECVPTYTNGIITARGYKVPPRDIEGLRAIPIPSDVFNRAQFNLKDRTGKKGRKAVFVVRELIKRGMMSTVLNVQDVQDKDMQIKGTDVLVKEAKVQVKCDWKSGPRAWGGTGNLYLQIAECNPYHQY